ncbi:hypothetical protein AOC03_11140 [Psychrobacter urativorans]|uniref:Uncharacterized protein n=1 Tax=Psychrobacter urativorans TaxID=45610 RepID=A0A0M3V9F0_9GAMM|nr:hypothetical protein AOC03_11140 [Psychrobacter urativorans]
MISLIATLIIILKVADLKIVNLKIVTLNHARLRKEVIKIHAVTEAHINMDTDYIISLSAIPINSLYSICDRLTEHWF